MGPIKSGIIDEAEFNRIGVIPAGRGHWLRLCMKGMNVGQVYKVERSEWDWLNKTPNVIVKDLNNKGPMQFELFKAADHSGWLIRRVE